MSVCCNFYVYSNLIRKKVKWQKSHNQCTNHNSTDVYLIYFIPRFIPIGTVYIVLLRLHILTKTLRKT